MPACVTISRSVDDTITGAFDNSREKRWRDGSIKSAIEGDEDGFTPALQADMIQRKVLEIIRDVFLEQGTELKVHELFARGTGVDDLDCFQKCYSLFLNGHVPKVACSEGKEKI